MDDGGYRVMAEGELGLDGERVSELSSENRSTLLEVGDRRLTQSIRFQLCLGEVERKSAKGTSRGRYRLPFQAVFLPTTGAFFHNAHLYIAAEEDGDPRIDDVRPSDLASAFVEDVETGAKGSIDVKHLPIGAGVEISGGRKRKEIPIIVRSGGMGSREADWEFDGSRVDGGLPTRISLELDVSLDGLLFTAGVRMTAGIKWHGILRWLPFVWPVGAFSRELEITLPPG